MKRLFGGLLWAGRLFAGALFRGAGSEPDAPDPTHRGTWAAARAAAWSAAPRTARWSQE